MDKDLKPVKAQRMRGCIVLALDGHLYLPTSSQGSEQRGVAKRSEEPEVEKQQSRCSYELTTVGTAYTRFVQDEARHKPSGEWEGGREVPPLLRNYWQLVLLRKGSQFSAGMQQLRGYPCPTKPIHITYWQH